MVILCNFRRGNFLQILRVLVVLRQSSVLSSIFSSLNAPPMTTNENENLSSLIIRKMCVTCTQITLRSEILASTRSLFYAAEKERENKWGLINNWSSAYREYHQYLSENSVTEEGMTWCQICLNILIHEKLYVWWTDDS